MKNHNSLKSLKEQLTPVLIVETLPEELKALIGENYNAFGVLLSPEGGEASNNSATLNFGEALGNFKPDPTKMINVPQKRISNDIAIDFVKFLSGFLQEQDNSFFNLPNSQFHILEDGRAFLTIRDSFHVGEGDVFAVFCKQRKDAPNWGTSPIVQKLKEHPELVVPGEKNYLLVKENGEKEVVKGIVFTPHGSEYLLKGKTLSAGNLLPKRSEEFEVSKKLAVERLEQ